MKNQMFNIVKDAIHMFMQMKDVNSLECFCVLLNYIKPKLKKVIHVILIIKHLHGKNQKFLFKPFKYLPKQYFIVATGTIQRFSYKN